MSRLSSAAFGTLAAATVAAFFVTQHLKVSTPLVAGFPRPAPSAFNPVDGRFCEGRDHRMTRISFYLLNHADDVNVYAVSRRTGAVVRMVASHRHMRKGVRIPDGEFSWNGREDSGAVAPDGAYYFRVVLLSNGRKVNLSNTPVQIITTPPRPAVTSVSPSQTPGGSPVKIRFSGGAPSGASVLLYHVGRHGMPRLVQSFGTGNPAGATWNGMVHGRPAPRGKYLVGLQVTDQACNTGTFPAILPPTPRTTQVAEITVRP